MKTIVHTRYGPPDLLALRDADPPTLGDTPEALRYLGAGHARGKGVIPVAEA